MGKGVTTTSRGGQGVIWTGEGGGLIQASEQTIRSGQGF